MVIQNSIEVGHKDFCSSSRREDECVKFDPVPETFHWSTNSRLSLGEGESTKALILLHLEPVSERIFTERFHTKPQSFSSWWWHRKSVSDTRH